jgi:transcriptional regulator with XRE-family HTH domain
MPQEPERRCEIRASFATALRNWRSRNNVPLKRIAGDLGLSVATISGWELGKRFPTGHHFELLSEYTGLPPCRLFCIMAEKCIPRDCLMAMRKSGRGQTAPLPAVFKSALRKTT